ncbi:MAG: c-type cytochrome [Betaproteobacteria bacterium]|nr:c-type cytochrome [Betaproteobacteria bacterium]
MRKAFASIGVGILAPIILASCGKPEIVSGQVFVVTSGRDNIKLALVEVRAIPEKVLLEHFLERKKSLNERQRALIADLMDAEKKAYAAKVASERASAEFLRLSSQNERLLNAPGNKTAENKINSEATYRKSVDYFYSLQEQLKDAWQSNFLIDQLPATEWVSKTDADGKFQLRTPSGKHAISATISRNAMGTLEIYSWLIWSDASGASGQQILLSNDNLFGSNCKECVRPTQHVVLEAEIQSEITHWSTKRLSLADTAASNLPSDGQSKPYSTSEQMSAGQQIYANNCIACHQANGKGVPPAFPPLAGSKVVVGLPDKLVLLLLRGRPGTAMQSFENLTDSEIAALSTFTRNSFGNRTGDIVQPSLVNAIRDKSRSNR